MSKYSRLEMIDFLNERMRPLKWVEWQMVTWEKIDKWCELLGFGSRPTKRVPDAGESRLYKALSSPQKNPHPKPYPRQPSAGNANR